MAFQQAHYWKNGNPNTCIEDYFWFNGSTAPFGHIAWVYNEFNGWYWFFFKRYGEFGGMYYWYNAFTSSSNGFVNNGNAYNSQYNTSPFDFINAASGPELQDIQQNGQHTWRGAGGCAVLGCTDPNANNYNPNATQNDGSCTYNQGCTDPSAYNYDPNAYINDGSCVYQGCMDPNANNYNPNATISGTCTYNQPTVSFSRSPSTITSGQSSTLSWSTSNAISGTIPQIGYNISPVGSGSKVVYPTTTTTYTLNVFGYGGTSASASTTVTVYTPPNVNISVSPTTIAQGGTATLTWTTTGDASSASINQGIGSVPLSSNTTVNPTSTTTYTISVSGSGGSDSAQVTLSVLPPPSASISATPNPLTYGSNMTINYSTSNCNTVTIYRYYTVGNSQVQQSNLTVTANTTGSITDTIVWNDYEFPNDGPLNGVQYTISASNGYTSASATTGVIPTATDRMPDLITIPPSDNLEKDEEPVTSPVVESSALLVDDIDVPVEIKASEPIKVDIDGADNWQDVRELNP